MTFRNLIVEDDIRPFAPIEPPFNMNSPTVTVNPPEVTGGFLLNAVLQRFGWPSFAGRTVIDLGCGVRFARAIHNLNMPFGRYVGVDIHAEAMAWLQQNLRDERFQFAHLDAQNTLYNPDGAALNDDALVRLGVPVCDGAMMFSVITHQGPDEAALTFRQLHQVVAPGGPLYFTAFLNEDIADYLDAKPQSPGFSATYHPAHIIEIAQSAGWRVRSIHPGKNAVQQPALICTRLP